MMSLLLRSPSPPYPSLSFQSPAVPLSKIKHGSASATLSLINDGASISRTDPLRIAWSPTSLQKRRKQCRGPVCYAAPVDRGTLQWVSAVSCAVLMLVKGTAIQKSFLVPLFALQAPSSVISWIKGDYGIWTAFLALLVRLFYFIPGELELPYFAMLLAIVAPYQAMNLRGSQAGAIVCLAITGYLAFQHFSRAGSLRRAFDQGSIIATLAVICITSVTCLFCV